MGGGGGNGREETERWAEAELKESCGSGAVQERDEDARATRVRGTWAAWCTWAGPDHFLLLFSFSFFLSFFLYYYIYTALSLLKKNQYTALSCCFKISFSW